MFTIHSRFAAFYSALLAKRAAPIEPDFGDSIEEIRREGNEQFGPQDIAAHNRAAVAEFEAVEREMQAEYEHSGIKRRRMLRGEK